VTRRQTRPQAPKPKPKPKPKKPKTATVAKFGTGRANRILEQKKTRAGMQYRVGYQGYDDSLKNTTWERGNWFKKAKYKAQLLKEWKKKI